MTTNAAQARNILGELDHRMGLDHYAEDRASFWHELFFVQSIEEYLLFLWLEADAEELQGNVAQAAIECEAEEQARDADLRAALIHYARAAAFRGGIISLLRLDYRPFLPAWIDELGERWHGQGEQQEGEAIYSHMDDQALGSFADRQFIEGNRLVSSLCSPSSPGLHEQRAQATQYYKAAALARRRLIGGWLLQYAAGQPRMILDEVDLADLKKLKTQLEEAQATIARLAPQARDPYVDEVGQVFHLGMVGSGHHTRALNERKMAALDRTIETANKLAPLYRERTRLLGQIEDVWSGRNQRRRKRKAAEEEWLRQTQERVQKAKGGDYVLDAAFGVVRVVRRNRKSLTIETTSGYREPRPFDRIIDIAPDPSQPPQASPQANADENRQG
ncbi:MAG TPA: hypothetical protein VFV38_45870 [Ktedonobacteraceae bacterium]|nr:hypothetical protein [Ktedonobacteraceae bacterium]